MFADIIFSEKQTVFRECSSRKTVSFEEQVMSKDKYPSFFSRQIGGYCVYYPGNIFRNTQSFQNYIGDYNPSNLFAHTRLVLAHHVTEYSPAKTVEYPRIFPSFENSARCEKDLKDDKDNSLHLGLKYAWIFVLGHYLFLVAHSFPRASLSENCSLLGTDNVRGQISVHIFAPNGDYCLYILGHSPILAGEYLVT